MFCVVLQQLEMTFDMKKIKPILFLAAALSLSACAGATKDFSKRLRGTWKIVQYGVERPETRSLTAQPADYGTITFNKKWTGTSENASIFDNMTSRLSRQGPYNFRWSNTENIVVLRADGSSYSKSWIVVTNKKDHQVWKSTDGANEVNTLELRR